MLKRAILCTALISTTAFATNPFSNNNFTLKSDKIREAESFKEKKKEGNDNDNEGETIVNRTAIDPTKCEHIDFEILDNNLKKLEGKDSWPPTVEYQKKPYFVSQTRIDKVCKERKHSERFSWVSLAIEQGEFDRDAFYGLAFSPLGDSKNFDIGLYKGNLYFWGKKKIPFYVSYGEPKADSTKEEAAETLMDKGAGLQISFPMLWTYDSGIHPRNSEAYKQSRFIFGAIPRLVAKEISGETESEYTYGYNMSVVLQYNAYLEVLSLAGEGNTIEPGSLNIEFNYTHHDYSDDALKTVANNLNLLETEKFSDNFNTYGYTITAEIGKVISLKYQWEKIDDPLFGTDKISRFILEKQF